jgi:hypothetical protein
MLELHQSLRLLAEALEAPAEQLLLLRIARLDRDAVLRAAREGVRQIFLDRDGAGERHLLAAIGDAVAARTEHFAEAIAGQLVALRQREEMVLRHRG